MYDRNSQALCVADSKGLCLCLEVVVEAASTSMLTFRRSAGGVRLQVSGHSSPCLCWLLPSSRLLVLPLLAAQPLMLWLSSLLLLLGADGSSRPFSACLSAVGV